MNYRLYAFGGLRLEAEGKPVTGAPAQRRRLALLALLAAAGSRGLTREKAFGFLWPEHTTARARHQLSESLYVLRQSLGNDAITTAQDDMRLDGNIVWSDLAAFRQGLSNGSAELALSLYAGPFLDGFFVDDAAEFDQWVATERESLARDYARALQLRAEQADQAGNAPAAAEWWRRLTLHDPHASGSALRYMEALVRAGDRARALQHAELHIARLRDDVGVEPDAEIRKLVAQLQRPIARDPVKPAAADELGPDYEVVRVIGTGKVARVYLAREPALRRLVAIKVLLPDFAADETARLRFEREAQSAARIHHPNVATAYRFGRLPSGAPFIALPYISGGSLEDRLAAAGPLSIPDARRTVCQIAAGLAAAHRLGIVNRDVRPANVLYDRDNDRVLLTDFGLAAVLDLGAEASLRLTLPGESLGSVSYASPEQLCGEPVTERADVYSLGILAFEMMTGRLPFEVKSPTELLIAQATVRPKRLREFLPHADAETEALIDRCLNKRPEQRPFVEELVRNE
ncbi:MAG: protein kinase domain-containing protein [Longimicrobiales bacterium]